MASDDPDPDFGRNSNGDEKFEESITQSQVFGNGAINLRQTNASHSLMNEYNPKNYADHDRTKNLDDDKKIEKKRKTPERDVGNEELRSSPKHQS